MDIIVNGETKHLPEPQTAADLVEKMGLAGKRIAVEINRDIVPRNQLAHHPLNPGDRVEIVQAIGGG